jgi:hypothetical protein
MTEDESKFFIAGAGEGPGNIGMGRERRGVSAVAAEAEQRIEESSEL